MNGQAIVEVALVMPILLFLLIGIVATGYLYLSAMRMQNGVTVLAQMAAVDPDWRSDVKDIDERVECHAKPLQPDLDGDTLTWTCHLQTGWLFDGLPIRVSAIVARPAPTASPEVSP